MRLFTLSALKVGVKPVVIPCTTTNDKPRTLAAEIANIPDDTLLICSDAFDVLCLKPAPETAICFESAGKDIVFGAEKVAYHHFPSSRKYFDSLATSDPYRYLNGGVVVGRAGAIRQMLRTIAAWDLAALEREFRSQVEASEHFNDQTLFGLYASLNPETVGLDTSGCICWNPHGEFDELEKALAPAKPKPELVNPSSGVQPCFLHITQIAKYYPLYLTAALVLGLPLNASTVDIDLFDRHMTRTVENIDKHVVEVDPRVSRVMARSLAYRRLKARQAMIAWYKKLRMDLGRRRRTLLRTGQR
jgi:hypothetical protein